MGKRAIIFFWLLLLIPTLLIAAGAFRLLRHEQARIDSVRAGAAREMGGALADSLQITIADVKENLLASLRRLPTRKLAGTLRQWEVENYLVRNVFVWTPEQGLLLPDVQAGTTREEKSFINRYDALFSGRFGWPPVSGEDVGVAVDAAPEPAGPGKLSGMPEQRSKVSPLVESIDALKADRRKMVQAAKRAPQTNAPTVARTETFRGGWVPWFEENRLHILGWGQQSPSGPVYGLELELMALLSRLVPEFASISDDRTVYALRDGSGRILSQSSGVSLDPQMQPDITVSLAPHLPHWQVVVYLAEGAGADASGRSLYLLSGLLFGIFIVAILSGGGLLTWQALRNLKDARQKTSFVSNVSHELKTPLTSIMMYAELLMEGRVKHREKRAHYLKVIVDESRRLTRLVNNVLDFSRLEQGRKRYRHTRLDVGSWLLEAADLHRVRLGEAAMALELEAVPGRFFATVDRDTLDQVLLNLVDNAIKYAAAGGYVGIGIQSEGRMHHIRFEDRGPGVPVGFQTRLFDKFQRADDSLTTSKPGSGLGLSIARQLMRDQGGGLYFERVPEGGSRFVITIPAKETCDDA